LEELPCTVVYAETENRKVTSFPDHDLGICFLYSHRIPDDAIAAPHEWVNFHPGPLPEYRGRNIAYHAIMNQADSFGATIHYMDAEFDTGEIIEVARFPIEPHHTAGDLVRLSHLQLSGLFEKYVVKLLQGRVSSQPQSQGRYYRKTLIEDTIELTPQQSRKVRALTVHPRFHATTTIGGMKYKIVPTDEDAGDSGPQVRLRE